MHIIFLRNAIKIPLGLVGEWLNKSQFDSSYAIDEEAMKSNIPNDSEEEKQETTDEGPKQDENPGVRFINKTDVGACTGLGKHLSRNENRM